MTIFLRLGYLTSVVAVLAIFPGCGKDEEEKASFLANLHGTWIQACRATADGAGYIKQEVISFGEDSMALNQTYASDAECLTKTLENKFVYLLTLGGAASEPAGATELTAKATKLLVTPHIDAVTNVYNAANICTSGGTQWVTAEERVISSCAGVGDASQYTLISIDEQKKPKEIYLGDCDQSGRDCSLPEKRPTKVQDSPFQKQ